MPCRNNNGHDGHVTVQIQLPLLTATLVLQLEPGKIVVVWANFVVSAEPVIQHANRPNELMILEIIDEIFSSHGLHTVPNRIVSTTRREKPPPYDIACSGNDGTTNQRDCERPHSEFHNWSCGHARLTVLPAREGLKIHIHTQSHAQ